MVDLKKIASFIIAPFNDAANIKEILEINNSHIL